MKSLLSVLVASTFLASAAFAMTSCGSDTNNFIEISTSYSPYPANPKERICFRIKGKIQQPIPSSSKATMEFSLDGTSEKYPQIFGETLEPKRYDEIPRNDKADHLMCFFFPQSFMYKSNAEVNIKLLVEYGDKRVLCFHETVKI
ncbi:hypothetical protein BG000_001358 [Podila horticola]|nr:hypothetical protein BG000_001358 [Podila horticola]